MAVTYKVVRDGTEFFVNSLAEAAELHRALSTAAAASPIPKRAVTTNLNATLGDAKLNASAEAAFNLERATVEFLQAIKNGGSQGVAARKIGRILRVEHPKGIGGRMGPIKKYLASIGFNDVDELFENPKSPLGGRIWKPKAKLDAALEAAKRAIGGKEVPR